MIDLDDLDGVVKQIISVIPPVFSDLQSDVEKNIKQVLQGVLADMDVVSRDEFDAQVKVLQKTRQKLDELLKQSENK